MRECMRLCHQEGHVCACACVRDALRDAVKMARIREITAANQGQVRACVRTCMCVCKCAPTPPALSRSSSLFFTPSLRSQSPTTAVTPRPLSPPPLSLPKAREIPEDRLGQVVQLIIFQIEGPAGDTGERGRDHARPTMHVLARRRARGEMCRQHHVCVEREDTRRCPRSPARRA